MIRPSRRDIASPRDRLRRHRRRALLATLGLVASLSGVGGLLAAPHELASVRLAGVSLAWWATLAAYGAGLVVLTFRPRAHDRHREPG